MEEMERRGENKIKEEVEGALEYGKSIKQEGSAERREGRLFQHKEKKERGRGERKKKRQN